LQAARLQHTSTGLFGSPEEVGVNGGGGDYYSDYGENRSPTASSNTPTTPPRSPNPQQGKGGGVPHTEDPCDIREQAVMRSPNPGAVANVSVGDPVTIRSININGADVLVAEANGVRLGVVDAPSEAALLDCMKAGNSYGGTIAQKQGGAVSVAI
jgi:hypothetical protein